MSYSREMYIQEIKKLRDLEQELKLKLSFTLSSMEQETRKLEVSLEEAHDMARNLSNVFYGIHLTLSALENQLVDQLQEVILGGLTEEDYTLDPPTLH